MVGSTPAACAVAQLSALPGVQTAGEMAAAAEHDAVTGRVLPVLPELHAMFPSGGLRRGSTVSVRGPRSLLLALLAEATTQGSWAAVVGMPDIGVVAAAELGVDVHRLAVVPEPGAEALPVIAALLDGIDLVVLGRNLTAPGGLTRRQIGKLSTRARHRGAVLLAAGELEGSDLILQGEPGGWCGIDPAGTGHGYLREREVDVHCSGKGPAAKPVRTRVLLPGSRGRVAQPQPFAGEPHMTREVS